MSIESPYVDINQDWIAEDELKQEEIEPQEEDRAGLALTNPEE